MANASTSTTRVGQVLVAAVAIVALMLAGAPVGAHDNNQSSSNGFDLENRINFSGGYVGQNTITGRTQDVQGVIRDYIDTLGGGDELLVSVYIFTSASMRDSLVAAGNRGVAITVLSDVKRYNQHPSQRAHLNALQTQVGATVHLCYFGCQTDVQNQGQDTGIMHEKTLIANVANGRDWAIVGSMNFTNQDLWEQAFYFDGDHYFELQNWLNDRFEVVTCNAYTLPSNHGTATLPPSVNPGVDPTCGVVGDDGGHELKTQGTVRVLQPGSPTTFNMWAEIVSRMTPDGSQPGGCRLEVVMGHLDETGPTQTTVIEMRKLRDRGCSVHLIYGGTQRPAMEDLATAAAIPGQKPINIAHDPTVHAKFMLFHGHYDDEHENIAWMGSANLHDDIFVANDELNVRVRTDGTFDALRRYFLEIRDAAK